LIRVEALKTSIITYLSHFGMYDYVGYAWLVLVFFTSLILTIFLTKKSTFLSIFMLFTSLALLFAGPFVLKHYLDKFLRAHSTKTTSVKRLNFTNALIVNGEITNTSKHSFSTCSVDISILKNSTNHIKNILNRLKPIREMTISIDKPIGIGETKEFRVVFDRYTYKQDVNVSVNSSCY